MSWTVTELIADVRRLGQLPASITDAEVLAHCNYELQASVVPLLLRSAEEYLVRRVDIPLTAGTARYVIPRRSVGSRVRDVNYLKGGGLTHLPRLKPEQVDAASVTQQGFPFGFYLDAAHLVLLPPPSAADTLRVAFYARPSRLVEASATSFATIATVTADSPSPGRTTITFNTGPTGALFDVVSKAQPFEHKAMEATAANVGATTADFATSDFSTPPVVGDYLCVPDYAPVPQIPLELFSVLSQRAAGRALQGLGYLSEASAAWQAAQSREADAMAVLTPRTDGNPRRLSGGLLTQMARGSGSWRGW